MSGGRPVLTVAQRVETGSKGEDRLLLEQHGARTLAIVADGAGGTGGGALAAEIACALAAERMRAADAATPRLWEQCLVEVDRALVRAGSGGECTAVIAEIRDQHVAGASVGDSGAWLLAGREIRDLTERQHRKPLLGSGAAEPVGFGPERLSGRLLLATDGLFKYATRRDIQVRATGLPVGEAVETLVAGLRLRSGALQDDVAIILMEFVD